VDTVLSELINATTGTLLFQLTPLQSELADSSLKRYIQSKAGVTNQQKITGNLSNVPV